MKRLVVVLCALVILAIAASCDTGSGQAWLRCIAHYGNTDVCAAKAGYDAGR